jgi:hypothetical protein
MYDINKPSFATRGITNLCIGNAKDGDIINYPLSKEEMEIARENYAQGMYNMIDILKRSGFEQINEYPILMRRDKYLLDVMSPNEIYIIIRESEEEMQIQIDIIKQAPSLFCKFKTDMKMEDK